jgi:Ulp1 family protease
MHGPQDGVINAYLAKVFDNLPGHMAQAVHLFSTFFFTKLLGPKPAAIRSTPEQILSAIKYMDVRRCDIWNWAFLGCLQ